MTCSGLRLQAIPLRAEGRVGGGAGVEQAGPEGGWKDGLARDAAGDGKKGAGLKHIVEAEEAGPVWAQLPPHSAPPNPFCTHTGGKSRRGLWDDTRSPRFSLPAPSINLLLASLGPIQSCHAVLLSFVLSPLSPHCGATRDHDYQGHLDPLPSLRPLPCHPGTTQPPAPDLLPTSL